jgi:hypothetical protein
MDNLLPMLSGGKLLSSPVLTRIALLESTLVEQQWMHLPVKTA